MVKKQIVSAVLALTLTLGAAGLPAADGAWFGGESTAISASAATYGDYTYTTLSDGTVEITKYTGSKTTVEIPSQINGKAVTSIGDDSFDGYDNENCKAVTSVTIPDGVTKIGEGAFFCCENLKTVKIPSSVKSIGGWAFYYCPKLKNITLPNGIDVIDRYAFYCDESLTSITIPDSVIGIGDNAFVGCYGLTSVVIPDSVTTICGNAFFDCKNLTSVTLPKNLTIIDYSAFGECPKLKSITIPKTVTYIGESAFGTYYNAGGNEVKVSGFTVYCYSGTEGETYAKNNGFNYVLLDSSTSVPRVTTNGFTSKTNSVTIKWNKVSGASGYRIYRYNTSTKKWSIVTTIKNGNTLTYTQSGLKSGTVYKYKVKAYTKKNGSTTWGESSETLKTATTPAKTVISSASKGKTAVKLNWNKVNGADGYKVQQYVGGKWTTIKTVDSATATYKVTGLKKGTAYKFRIRAFKKVGGQTIFGAYSTVKTVTTKK
jgi:hypothetical protein